ncbi:HPP family protein [Massilia sp. erpn]|uniref:HPP family protein n=1 Tax=Massilia sp. erpn TaxID=2738142 RepID=UPI002103942B|nr:HPP family protein [Massilia sp. erpn]UTY56784.1 HPP family protein [Massilia sp. erpn]
MLKPLLERWLPLPHTASLSERLRACTGAMLGLLLTAVCSHWLLGDAALYLVAPMGASAVLLFCLPASPLAQPWSVIGGNVVSGLVGAACVRWLGPGMACAALASCGAIAAMFALRCLHPPGGAVALTTVIGGPAVHAAGFGFALGPVLLNSAVMVLGAVLYNNLSGRRYPHAQHAPPNPHATRDPLPTGRLGFQPADLDAVLRQYGQVLDVSRDDLESIIQQTEMRAYQRRFGQIRCASIMSQDVVTVEFGTPLAAAWQLMQHHRVAALPVLNPGRRVIGIVTQGDFLRHSGLDDFTSLPARLRHFLQPSGRSHGDKPEVVGQIMTTHPQTAALDTPIADLVPLMADSGLHHIPVVDAAGRCAGILTQSDLMAALYESRLADMQQAA